MPKAVSCTAGRAIHRRRGSVWCDGPHSSGLSTRLMSAGHPAATPQAAARSVDEGTATSAQAGSPASRHGARGSRRSRPGGAEAQRPQRRSSPHRGSAARDHPGGGSRSSAGSGEHAQTMHARPGRRKDISGRPRGRPGTTSDIYTQPAANPPLSRRGERWTTSTYGPRSRAQG